MRLLKAIINGVIVTEKQMIYGKSLLFDKNIKEITDCYEFPPEVEVIDAEGKLVIAGLIDLHIHGYGGMDVSDGKSEDIAEMSRLITENGVTAWCPTTMTVEESGIMRAFNAVREASEMKNGGAQIMGVNCEGPFISPAKKGAHIEEHIKKPEADFIIENSDIVKLVTIAPEMDTDFECIRKICENTSVIVSLGHTEASFECAKKAVDAGATHATHLYNAMAPLDHRSPGILGEVLSDKRVSCELIADTFHVSPELYSLTESLKKNKLVLITDCMRAGGLEDGEYDLGGQMATVKGIECRLENGVIAGSVLRLNQALRNMKKHTALPVWKIVNMASLNAATVIGMQETMGSIKVGKKANIAIVDKEFEVYVTIINGEVCYKREDNG